LIGVGSVVLKKRRCSSDSKVEIPMRSLTLKVNNVTVMEPGEDVKGNDER
jgi:hypothetical protein